jgi:hypothetical protein
LIAAALIIAAGAIFFTLVKDKDGTDYGLIEVSGNIEAMEAGLLTLFGVLMALLANRKFKKKLVWPCSNASNTCLSPIRGNLVMLFFATALYLMTTPGMGLLISTVSQTQQQAMMSMFFFYFPAVLLSGFMSPVANMPVAVQWLTYLNPLRYFLVIIRCVFLKGVGPAVLWPQMLALAFMGLATLALASGRFRKTLA